MMIFVIIIIIYSESGETCRVCPEKLWMLYDLKWGWVGFEQSNWVNDVPASEIDLDNPRSSLTIQTILKFCAKVESVRILPVP